ncbi:uncharacterized protein [Spinacia oleracea]|uniref:Uncharacterized protein isoform X2 n=1 Tax=Spinacia oleracea TaxID=3562 RepID=A0ABM3QKB0_SPIOL|nr:uncharacterized protein LOC130460139 isoform X2 [Spinacia oleracea]
MAQQQMVATQVNRQQVRESIQSKRIEGSSASESSQVRLVKSAAQNKLLQSQPEKEDELGVQSKKGQSKTMVAPGSLSAYMQMKATLRGKELRAKKSDVLLREHVGKLKTIHTYENQVASSTVIVGSCSRTQPLGHGLEEEYEDHMSSDECDMDAEDAEFGLELNIHANDQLDMQIEPQIRQELESERIAPSTSKRTRGQTMCKDVHEWTLNDRKPIILNEMGKPIGPNKKTLDKFSRFLGTLARNSSLAPSNKLNWPNVPDKDNIWSYVKKKYIISEEGKDHVLSSVGKLWRKYKCSVKANHFTPYNNNADRWESARDTIPDSHFKDLLEFWNLDQIQEESQKKRESNINQRERHTMGPTSFVRRQYELQQQDVEKKPPSHARLYKETRKRKVGKEYKTPYETIQSNIDKMEEVQRQRQIDGDGAFFEVMNLENSGKHKQLGRCSKVKGKSKKASVGGVIIPDEYIQPYKDQIVKDTVAEVLKMFKQQLPPESFAHVMSSFPESPRVTEDQEHDQDQDDGLDRIENED